MSQVVWFQAAGPATEKVRQPNMECHCRCTNSWWQLADRRCNVMWSLRWHFTNKSVTGAPYSIKGHSYSLSHSRTLWWRVRWLKHAVPSWGRSRTAAMMAQNEQTTEEHSTLQQQSPRRLNHPAWCVVWSVWPSSTEKHSEDADVNLRRQLSGGFQQGMMAPCR